MQEIRDESLAIEILREVKHGKEKEAKRKDIIIIILILVIFAETIAWLVAWNLPAEETTETTSESYELQGEDNANVVWNNDGEVKINEQNPSSENENSNN